MKLIQRTVTGSGKMSINGWAEWIAEKGLNIANFRVKKKKKRHELLLVKSLTKPWLSRSLRHQIRLLSAEVNPGLTFFPRLAHMNVCFAAAATLQTKQPYLSLTLSTKHLWQKTGAIRKEDRPTNVWQCMNIGKYSNFCSSIQLKK